MGTSPIETKKVARRSASCHDRYLVQMFAEVRKHPGRSALPTAMLAAVQPGNLRCSAWHKVAGKKIFWEMVRSNR